MQQQNQLPGHSVTGLNRMYAGGTDRREKLLSVAKAVKHYALVMADPEHVDPSPAPRRPSDPAQLSPPSDRQRSTAAAPALLWRIRSASRRPSRRTTDLNYSRVSGQPCIK